MQKLGERLKKTTFSLILACFFLLIAFGNALRLVESVLFSDHLPLSEGLLYGASFLSLFFLPVLKRSFLVILTFSLLLFCSFLYGCVLHGFDAVAFLYVGRLVCQIVSCYVLVEISLERFQGQIIPFFLFLSQALSVSLVFGFILYLFFPESKDLWVFLQDYHVVFHGDPHEGRFVSIYFDPNYYACIAGFGFLIHVYLYKIMKKTRYGVLSFLYLLSGVLTWSRSGIAVLLLLFLFPKTGSIKQNFREKVLALGSLVGVMAWYSQDMGVFFQRIGSVFQEASALCRWKTFLLGLSLWKEHLLFGVGMNFLRKYTIEETGLASLDSSLLSLLVQIGGLPFLGCMAYVAMKSFSFFPIRGLWQKAQPAIPYFYSWFVFYGVLVVVFASLFNNVLFYPFWALPFFVALAYMIRSVQEKGALERASFVEKSSLYEA